MNGVNPVALITEMLGGLVPTYLLSRLALYLLKKWEGGIGRLAAGHVASLALCTVIAGFGMADGGSFAWEGALSTYFLPQVFWFGFDVWRERRKSIRSDPTPNNQQAPDQARAKSRFKNVMENVLALVIGLITFFGAKYLVQDVLLKPSLDDEIAQASVGLNRNLPQKIDEITTLERTSSKGPVLQYHYTILLTPDLVDAKTFSSNMSSQLKGLVCSADSMVDTLNDGGGYRYTYVYETGQPLFDTTLFKADCIK
ncbi:hypothetical protein O4H49_08110 [Kiloniella laminariae]|uniref:Uncharacterized protein n=1 Tax=Kiloniella laminariae TaxID=454162 RepID=A0ABT4LI18_9PROT|nr:hypothetical protein [Kiloniella laminariae]MCZ4280738.1 hypothetical protein [Kiloniella laminariae]